ncbi:MAG: hypothetical protein ACI9MC_002875 [Kiritimatiellia bacterium]|jgi:hypothetical protein
MRATLLILALAACNTSSDVRTPDVDPDTDTSTEPVEPIDELEGFIGSPCEADSDCPYEGGRCITDDEDYPRGMCTASCERYCDDLDGYPTTFCVERAQAPAAAASADGGCFSRCDFGAYPDSGCRQDYGCVVRDRANDVKQAFVCAPNQQTELSACHSELADRGVSFEPAIVAPAHPDTHPNLTCNIEEPVYILGDVHGVELRYATGNPTPRVLAACEMAHALTDTIDDIEPHGVTALYHYGTYSCRVIKGTDDLSRHAYGDAIDIYGFEFDDGTYWTLIDDWEHDTSDPRTEASKWMRDAAYRWYDAKYWNIILTPNFNTAHDDHFHIDLTPGSDYIGATDGRYIGPAPYGD